MEILKNFIKWYMYITIGILIVSAVIFSGVDLEGLPKEILWQILLSGFFTTLVTVFLALNKAKVPMFLQYALHYVSLCGVMFICGKWFGWIEFDLRGIVMMSVAVALVYVLAFFAYWILELRQAKKINQKLKEKYGEEEE